MNRSLRTILLSLAAALAVTGGARAQVLSDKLPAPIEDLEVADKRGQFIPKDIQLYNAKGEAVYIGDYFNTGKPTVLLLVYYSCPKLCEVMLNDFNKIVNDLTFDIGEDYQVIVVSFDHTNTTSMAAGKQTLMQAGYRRGLSDLGKQRYLFHTATAIDARRLADAVGFDYKFLPQSGEFSHPSVRYILTPDGRVSNYILGIGPDPTQLRLAILAAGEGQISQSVADFFMQFCFDWDPTLGKYTLQAMRVMQLGGIVSVVAVASLVIVLRIREGARRRRAHAPKSERTTTRHARAQQSRPAVATVPGAPS